jgi:AcrR family transcriptional regulator
MTAARATASQSGAEPSTRDRLVELAADLFAERGYAQTSVRDISRRAAMTTGAIYGHFRNKAELLAEAISERTADQLESQTLGLGEALDYIETLTRMAREYPKRRQLRALIVQGAAAAQTDDETRARLRDEQLEHFRTWVTAYEAERDRMGIDPSLDLEAAVLHTWAVELGLGVLESMGIEPRSKQTWADVQNRLARSFQLPPDEARLRTRTRQRRT